MMPSRKHVTHHGPEEEERHSTAPPISDAADEVTVLWRKKQSAGSLSAGHPGPDDAAVEEQGVDWQERFKQEQTRADDNFAKWQRTAADIANMRRRHEQERQEYLKQANAMLIGDMLPVLDSFDRALASVPPELREMTWIDGVALVERQLRAVLERHGLSTIEAEGKQFDPNEHEALLHESSEQPADTVIGELQRGYRLHDRVLRPAMVKIAKNGNDN